MIKRIPEQYKIDRAYGPQPNWRALYREHCPVRTCPASRHARIIAEEILRDPTSPVRRLLIDAGYEPDHWASSIESTITSLWEARRWLKWEKLPPTKRYKINGHWVPAAQGIEGRQAGDVKQAPREAREPGPKDAPKHSPVSQEGSIR